MKRTSDSSAVTDPVCGMKINPADAAATSFVEGKTYYFCANSCKSTFERDPLSFVDETIDFVDETIDEAPVDESPAGSCCRCSA